MHGMAHPRRDLVVSRKSPRGSLYYYWLETRSRAGLWNGVDIHRKPGYNDSVELFLDPAIPAVN